MKESCEMVPLLILLGEKSRCAHEHYKDIDKTYIMLLPIARLKPSCRHAVVLRYDCLTDDDGGHIRLHCDS